MPFVNIKLMDGVFSIEELHTDGWHIGGLPFMGPKSIMDTLGRSKKLYESIDGHPITRAALLEAAPVIPRT